MLDVKFQSYINICSKVKNLVRHILYELHVIYIVI
jgi:hypothetical protein